MGNTAIAYREKVARELIVKALNAYHEQAEPITGPKSKRNISSSELQKKLTIDDVNKGVVAFVLFTKMTGGSIASGINLYELLQVYLLKPESRDEINEVVGKHQLEVLRPEAPKSKKRNK